MTNQISNIFTITNEFNSFNSINYSENIDNHTISRLSKEVLNSSNQSCLSLKNDDYKFKSLQLTFRKMKKIFAEITSVQTQFLAFFEYWSNNKNNIKNIIPFFTEQTEDWGNCLDRFENYYRWSNFAIPLITQVSQFLFLFKVENELKEYSHSSSAQSSHAHWHLFQSKVNQDKKEIKEKIFSKIKRLGIKILPPLIATFNVLSIKIAEKIVKIVYEIDKNRLEFLECSHTQDLQKEWFFHLMPQFVTIIKQNNSSPQEKEYADTQRFENQELKKRTKLFLISLHKSQTLKNVQDILHTLKLNIEIPPTIEQFKQQLKHPRFLRELVQHYLQVVGRKIALKEENIKLILQKKIEENQLKIDRCLPFIIEQLDNCRKQQFSLEQTKIHFAQLHIDIHSKILLQPTQDWEECLKNEFFIRDLAKQWVDFQETTAQLSMQGIRQALRSKLEVERKFLSFQKFQHCMGFITTALQFAVSYTPANLIGIARALEVFTLDLTKCEIPGIGLYYVGYPLYPELKLRIDSLFLMIFKHFFAIKYKPNEFSLESYKLSLQIHMTHLITMISFLQFLLQQGVLWITIRLVDNCIDGLESTPFTENKSFLDLIKEYEQYQLNDRKILQDLEGRVEQLKVNDAKLITLPPSQNNREPSEPFKNLCDLIKETNVDYFPTEVIEFFENHVGFKLTNESKYGLQDHLEKLFRKDLKNFSQSFSNQHFAFLRT